MLRFTRYYLSTARYGNFSCMVLEVLVDENMLVAIVTRLGFV